MTSEIEEVVILMHSFDFQNISPQCQDKFRNVALILHDSGKTGDGRRVEYVFEIAADAEFMIDMTNNTRRQQGITAEFKKVVLPPKFSVTQIFLPYLCDPALPVRNLMPLTFRSEQHASPAGNHRRVQKSCPAAQIFRDPDIPSISLRSGAPSTESDATHVQIGTTRVASRESPPSSKKLSCRPNFP